eukprot:CAMPEP_0116870724 /NCGR_PEP_ID=MMETSP0463-20121206/769_1 /TAXON_ID=181622 /ORGANISM="Strombidinopsis sp, Strain SopsisLIS2011" /LENGTH=61 /DNA_ID=CAMNT_0004507821 /DNA_START=5700 /DNA_END=5885 /DNA_ORIENTATION=-
MTGKVSSVIPVRKPWHEVQISVESFDYDEFDSARPDANQIESNGAPSERDLIKSKIELVKR